MTDPTDKLNLDAGIDHYDLYAITEPRRLAIARLNNMIRDAAIAALAIPGVTGEDIYLVMVLVASEARHCPPITPAPKPNNGLCVEAPADAKR